MGRAVIGREFFGEPHGGRADERFALICPIGKHRKVVAVVAQWLVDKHRDARVNKRTAPRDVFFALIGRNQYRIDVPNNVFGFRGDIVDHRDFGDLLCIGRIVCPDMGDLCAVDPKRVCRLFGHIVANCGVGAFGQCVAVVAPIDDHAPRIGMTIALCHAQHRQSDRCLLDWKIWHCVILAYHAVHPPSIGRVCPVI